LRAAGWREAGEFLPHSGIRFLQNGCISCPEDHQKQRFLLAA
jgi:hypothetical protein